MPKRIDERPGRGAGTSGFCAKAHTLGCVRCYYSSTSSDSFIFRQSDHIFKTMAPCTPTSKPAPDKEEQIPTAMTRSQPCRCHLEISVKREKDAPSSFHPHFP